MKEKRVKKTPYVILGIIGDCILIPVILLATFVTALIFADRRQNVMPTFMGYGVVRILSSSMTADGFKVGTNVIVKNTTAKDLWVDDIIAFYSWYDDVDKSLPVTKLNNKNEQIVVANPAQIIGGRTSIQDARDNKARIMFHKIIDVFYDANGTRFFSTKGTSNSSKDVYNVREDFVVGRYINTPQWMRDSLTFMTSPIGMITLVCLPLGILVILESLSLIEQLNFIYVEKKLVAGKMHWKDPEAQRLIYSGEMEEIAKIICLGKAKVEERDDMFEELWDFTKKIKPYYQQKIKRGYIALKQGRQNYWLYWKNNITNKKHIKMIELANVYTLSVDDAVKVNEQPAKQQTKTTSKTAPKLPEKTTQNKPNVLQTTKQIAKPEVPKLPKKPPKTN